MKWGLVILGYIVIIQFLHEEWKLLTATQSLGNMDHCFITAFYDIGRGEWENNPFKRTNTKYFDYFERFVRFPQPLLIFIDETLLENVTNLVATHRQGILTWIIPINETFLLENMRMWSLIEKEKEIMSSPKYQMMIKHRIHHPEHNNPRYTLINHAKVDFMIYGIHWLENKNFHFKRYSWIDFGYFHETYFRPKSFTLHLDELLPNQNITYFIMGDLNEAYANPFYILVKAPDLVTGGFFSGTKSVLEEYRDEYFKAVKIHQDFFGIANDDQDIISYIYYNQWNRFNFIRVSSYKHAFLYLCDYLPDKVNNDSIPPVRN